MKILIVRTFPSIMNFKQYNVQEIGLAKALVRKGYECGIVFYNGKNKDEIEYVPVSCDGEVRNITVYKLHGFNVLKNGFFPSLRKITKEYDVIQVHEYDQITSWLYYAWSKKPVVIYHGPYYDEFNKGYNFKCKIFDAIFLKIKNNRDVTCFTKSHAAADFLRSKGFRNVKAIGVGLDVENFESVALKENEKISVFSDKFNLIYVGKIEERRNSLFLLDVIGVLAQKEDRIHSIIVGTGEGEYKEQFLTKAKPLMDNQKLTYLESASQAQLADLYQKVQLMVFPSNYDIFGMVLLEANYFGLPVVSSKNGGADMLIEDGVNGLVEPDFSVEKWVAKIDSVIKDENMYRRFRTALHRNDVTWDAVAENYVDGTVLR